MGNMLLNAYSEEQSQFKGITWSITSLAFSASLFSLVSRPFGGIRIYKLRNKMQFTITTQTKNINNVRDAVCQITLVYCSTSLVK